MMVTAMAVGLLAGCGGNSGDTEEKKETKKEETKEEKTDAAAGSSNSSGSEDAETVLKWACWDLKTATYWQAVADAYQKNIRMSELR